VVCLTACLTNCIEELFGDDLGEMGEINVPMSSSTEEGQGSAALPAAPRLRGFQGQPTAAPAGSESDAYEVSDIGRPADKESGRERDQVATLEL
jgi:hypothetical protein